MKISPINLVSPISEDSCLRHLLCLEVSSSQVQTGATAGCSRSDSAVMTLTQSRPYWLGWYFSTSQNWRLLLNQKNLLTSKNIVTAGEQASSSTKKSLSSQARCHHRTIRISNVVVVFIPNNNEKSDDEPAGEPQVVVPVGGNQAPLQARPRSSIWQRQRRWHLSVQRTTFNGTVESRLLPPAHNSQG